MVNSNAHSTWWGARESDTRGQMVKQVLAQHDLVILNKGTTPTFRGHNGHSTIIDLTFCDKVTKAFVKGWHVSEEITPSDHQPIKFKIIAHREKIFKTQTIKIKFTK